LLECGNHTCKLSCHSSSCPPCPTSPAIAVTCACQKHSISELRFLWILYIFIYFFWFKSFIFSNFDMMAWKVKRVIWILTDNHKKKLKKKNSTQNIMFRSNTFLQWKLWTIIRMWYAPVWENMSSKWGMFFMFQQSELHFKQPYYNIKFYSFPR